MRQPPVNCTPKVIYSISYCLTLGVQFSPGCLIPLLMRRAPHSSSRDSLIPVALFVAVKGIDLRHFPIHQGKVKQLGVLPYMIRIAGTGNDNHTPLQIPAENDLRRGFSMGCG